MLSIDIIEKKTFRKGKDGKSILDLIASSWDTKIVQYQLRNIAIVTDDTEMRPDLLSLSYAGDSSTMGTLLKLNNISNPLSIASGEILAVPGQQMINKLFESIPKDTENQKSKSFRKELQEKISQISNDRIEYLNSKNISNIAQTPLPPNILNEGEQQILVEGGKLIFGPNIGQCRTKVRKNISVTDIKSKLAQKNIFKK